MKTLLAFLITFFAFSWGVSNIIPDKTVCIKHPEANDLSVFFQKNQMIFFEIKGNKNQAEKFYNALKKSEKIQSCQWGKTTGEFHGIQLVFKEKITGEVFKKIIKEAGAEYLKINNGPAEKI